MPRLETISEQYPNVDFVAIDVDANRDYCRSLGIKSVPTVMVFNGTNNISTSVGAQSDKFYRDILNNL